MESISHPTEITWRKSSYSGDTGGSCVEVADIPGSGPAVRDSKNPAGPILTLRPATFTAFLTWTVGERSQ
ncbi:toxin [Streptomyces caelestis]|uniref:Toxin n=1 Tax=Streptomyces caelestis TaxID=36816 RepID=A0A0M8QPE3_9ACTN|nr:MULTISPECIES: DUF397 domain-containing protein [Streptomyces]KOT35739.1 toxin [Streptomyces caelestis]KOV32808.1 toxin [Streptomyces sp. XY152]